jgi:hypothetical protein
MVTRNGIGFTHFWWGLSTWSCSRQTGQMVCGENAHCSADVVRELANDGGGDGFDIGFRAECILTVRRGQFAIANVGRLEKGIEQGRI